MHDRSRGAGRNETPGSIAVAYVVCRETRQEAEAFHHYYAVENADHAGVDYMSGQGDHSRRCPRRSTMRREFGIAAGNAGYPLIGSPEDVAAGIKDLADAGFDGAALIFLNYGDELPFFVERVLPLLEQEGLRKAYGTVANVAAVERG